MGVQGVGEYGRGAAILSSPPGGSLVTFWPSRKSLAARDRAREKKEPIFGGEIGNTSGRRAEVVAPYEDPRVFTAFLSGHHPPVEGFRAADSRPYEHAVPAIL